MLRRNVIEPALVSRAGWTNGGPWRSSKMAHPVHRRNAGNPATAADGTLGWHLAPASYIYSSPTAANGVAIPNKTEAGRGAGKPRSRRRRSGRRRSIARASTTAPRRDWLPPAAPAAPAVARQETQKGVGYESSLPTFARYHSTAVARFSHVRAATTRARFRRPVMNIWRWSWFVFGVCGCVCGKRLSLDHPRA